VPIRTSLPLSILWAGYSGCKSSPTGAGYARLLKWLGGFGTVCLVGIEGTGSYSAGLARHVAAASVRVVEAGRSDRQDRRRAGKSDPLDAVSAARSAQSGRAAGAPKGRDGAVEAIRALMVAKRSARAERTQTIRRRRISDVGSVTSLAEPRAPLPPPGESTWMPRNCSPCCPHRETGLRFCMRTSL
jgi:transposase